MVVMIYKQAGWDAFCQLFTGGGKLNSDPEGFTQVIRWQRLWDKRGKFLRQTTLLLWDGCSEAYHRIWFGPRDLCRWFIKILFMALMILSQEETYLILIIEVLSSMRLWLMLAVRECERNRVCVFLRILVNVFPFKRIVEDMYDL